MANPSPEQAPLLPGQTMMEQIDTQYLPPRKEEVQWIFDYTLLYWEIKARLRGGWVATDPKTGNLKIMIPPGAKQMLNDTGIEETMAMINGFMTKVQALSNIQEDRVLELTKELNLVLVRLYRISMERYDITPEKASVIIRMICDLYEFNARKSIGGRSLLTMGQMEKRSQIIGQEEQRKKILGII